MSPLPVQFTHRWGDHREGPSYEDSVCWHLLLGSDAGARAVVADVQQRIARFGGMHMTPVAVASRDRPARRPNRGAHAR